MPEPEDPGLSRLDVDRAHSMEDEGGASAARLRAEPTRGGRRPGFAFGVAFLAATVASLGLVRLVRQSRA